MYPGKLPSKYIKFGGSSIAKLVLPPVIIMYPIRVWIQFNFGLLANLHRASSIRNRWLKPSPELGNASVRGQSLSEVCVKHMFFLVCVFFYSCWFCLRWSPFSWINIHGTQTWVLGVKWARPTSYRLGQMTAGHTLKIIYVPQTLNRIFRVY